MNKLAVYDKLCCFIILSILKKGGEVALSSHFRHLFANLLGIINDASYLISVMASDDLVAHQGLFENTKLYQKITITDKGIKYLEENLNQVIIPENEFNEVHLDRIKSILKHQ
ncbi:hypothetical protein [Capnocytophaga gingivalis]|uniref:hypothetical protein n=1 Tax=Capnocytophaga gingivalis TaxID=1017 RepID=UPI0028D040C7|nr:hypothetical protein [Capnocytophaga gingivalis]